PSDVGLGGAPSELGDQAIRLLLGLIQHAVEGQVGTLAELLALVGITDDAAIPALPIADLISHGAPAWRTRLDELIGDQAAVTAWLTHLQQLVGHGAMLTAATGPG